MSVSIVIADDHPLMLRGLSDYISSKGFNIIGSAEDGKTAYNHIVKLKPDLALLDIRMPGMTGLEVAKACYKNNLPTKKNMLKQISDILNNQNSSKKMKDEI